MPASSPSKMPLRRNMLHTRSRKSTRKLWLHLRKWRTEQLWQKQCWRQHFSINLASRKHSCHPLLLLQGHQHEMHHQAKRTKIRHRSSNLEE
uniref:Uncharacterized protein n=1 Tax=Arundo donax TaxID=35708 RepID=A0A0A9CKT3_ARUDO